MERDLRRLRERADEQEQADRDDRPLVGREGLRRGFEDREVLGDAELLDQEDRGEDEPMSPITLITNAFIPALVAVSRRYQKLIRR